MPKVGRPTDYNDDILGIAKDYLTNFKTEHGHMIPSVVGLAKVLGKTRETLYAWAKQEGKEEFSDILAKINNDQCHELINGGLSGEFNSNITKLVLGKHGYHERQEVSGPGGKPVEFLQSISPTVGPPKTRNEDDTRSS